MPTRKLISEDCRGCGACCVSLTDSDVYADVTPKDEERLGKKFVRLNVVDGAIKTRWLRQRSGPFKGVEACSCVALRGSLFHKVYCAVYANRPTVCRKAVNPGDRTCRQARRLFRDCIESESERDGSDVDRVDGRDVEPSPMSARRGQLVGPKNPNWKGGRVVEPRGYVLVRVGVDHPLADVRGYAYEHRLKASQALGRSVSSREEVHHDDELKGNNSPDNLIVTPSKAHHHHEHHGNPRNKHPDEPNPLIACACGCGRTLAKFDRWGRPRQFISGHNMPRRANGRFGN